MRFTKDVRPDKWLGCFLCTVFAAMIVACWPSSGFAHRLSVFAWVEGNTVVVEGRFSGGKRPKKGVVYVYDGEDRLLLKTSVNADGTVRFPLPDYQTGLKIVMEAGEGHESYWILTPYDIETQLGKSAD